MESRFVQATDGHFARRIGNRFPLHVPLIAKPLIKPVVRDEHMQQVALAMLLRAPLPRCRMEATTLITARVSIRPWRHGTSEHFCLSLPGRLPSLDK